MTRYADITPLGNILITFLQMFITLISVVDVKASSSASIKHKQNILYNSGQCITKCNNEVRLFLRAEWVGW